MTARDDWTETEHEGLASVLTVTTVDLPRGRYVRFEVKSNPPIRLDMEPDGALWLARELLNARNEAQGREGVFPVKTLLMLGGEQV